MEGTCCYGRRLAIMKLKTLVAAVYYISKIKWLNLDS